MDKIVMNVSGGRISLTFQVEPDADLFTADCVELGVASCGSTADSAMACVREAVGVYLDGIEELGELERIFRDRGISVSALPQE